MQHESWQKCQPPEADPCRNPGLNQGPLVGRWARKPVNHTSWVAVVTPTDRPKSVRNRCLIELFCGVVCVVTLPF